MKILVVGGSGLVGGNCLKHFREQGFEVLGTHCNFPGTETVYFDACDLDNTANFDFDKSGFHPEVIINCAALTNVDYCEKNENISYARTVTSAMNVLKLALKFNSKLVYISTDYVFDGLNGPYTEDSLPNPIGVYGKHKYQAEQIASDGTQNHLIVRVTNVYGDEIQGKNFISRLINNTLSNPEIKLPIDQFATPINAFDIARALAKLVADDKTGTYHLGSTDYFNRYQLAFKVKNYLKSSQIKLIPQTTDLLDQPARRPLRAGLLNFKFLSEYPGFIFTNVDDYLSKYA